jgi:riboflavin kinase/FMN adenylyltransferase
MLVTRGGAAARASAPVAVTVGNFDGVHLGHQAMLARVVAAARERGVVPAVLTFEPHPQELFAPQSAPTRLTSLREKAELLAAHGMRRVHVRRFSRAFASLAPDAFVEQVLVRELQAVWVLVGDDFRYGTRRAGDLESLRAAGARFGFAVEAMPTILQHGERVSSSAVRSALAAGDLARARNLLGRAYSIGGRVVHGQKLGRQLGFATANVQTAQLLPGTGVYVVTARLAGRELPGVCNVGVKPTVEASGKVTAEVHLFDFDGRDLYGASLRVAFVARLREERRFAGPTELAAQIAADVAAARAML